MNHENKLTNIVQNLTISDWTLPKISEQLSNHKRIHSYIIYAKYKNDKKIGWTINYKVSQSNKYNTLSSIDVAENIAKKLTTDMYDNERKYIIGYGQGDLEFVIKQYKPLIIKLAKEQHAHWEFLEMEDLIQMCNLVISDLYYKGYYIHKQLIRRAYINYVLMHIRKDKNRVQTISLDQPYNKSDKDDTLRIADMIPDINASNELSDKEDEEVQKRILLEVKDIVIDFIGPRQYDQLLREYSNKQTTNWSRKLMQTIKAHLFEMGISNKSFNKYYG